MATSWGDKMSIRLDTEFDGRDCVVEFFRDGEMIIHGIDPEQIDYERSLEEFGEPPSRLNTFIKYNSTDQGPLSWWIVQAFEYFEKHPKETIKYTIDCVRHALLICEWLTKEESFDLCNDLINQAEEILESYVGLEDGPSTETLREPMESIINDTVLKHIEWAEESSDLVTEYILRATKSAAIPASALREISKYPPKTTALEYAVSAVGWTADTKNNEEIDNFKTKENRWQYKRLIDCFEAVQSGKPWPAIWVTQ